LESHPSIVDKLFAGIIRNTVRCGECGGRSVTYDPFLELTVEISKDSLADCLADYFSEEHLDCAIAC